MSLWGERAAGCGADRDRSEAIASRGLIWSTESVRLPRRAARGSVVALTLALAFPLSIAPRVASAQTAAPDGPGDLSRYDLARKDCVGTAANRRSKVWYTVADGVLSDVYSPTIDNTNLQSLRFIVTDGRTFTDLQGRDTRYTVRPTDKGGMACEVTTTSANGRWRLVTEYVTDATRDSVVMRNKLVSMHGPVRDLKLYVRYDATMNGNGGAALQRRRGQCDRRCANHGTGVVRHVDRESSAQSRLRRAAVRRAPRRPSILASDERFRRVTERRPHAVGQREGAHADLRRGCRRECRADRPSRRREERLLHVGARVRTDAEVGGRRRR